MYQIPVTVYDEESPSLEYQTNITVARDGWRRARDEPFDEAAQAFSADSRAVRVARASGRNAEKDREDALARLGLPNGRILDELSNDEVSRTDPLAGRCIESSRQWKVQAEELVTVEQLEYYHLPAELKNSAARLQKANPDLDITLRPNLDAKVPEWALRAADPNQPELYAELVYSEIGQSQSLKLRTTHLGRDMDGELVSGTKPSTHVVEPDLDSVVGQTDYQLGERALQFAADDVAEGRTIYPEENLEEAMAEPMNNSSPSRMSSWERPTANDVGDQTPDTEQVALSQLNNPQTGSAGPGLT